MAATLSKYEVSKQHYELEMRTYGIGRFCASLFNNLSIRYTFYKKCGFLGVTADPNLDMPSALLDVRHKIEKRNLKQGPVTQIKKKLARGTGELTRSSPLTQVVSDKDNVSKFG